jgi:predicted phage terminase large subunit-like protein
MSKTLTQAQVAKYLLKLRDAQDSFESFVKLIYPEWELADFQLELIDALDKLEKDTLGVNNVLITMPPRHAKSTFGTVLFPSYFMARNPQRYIMSCSYNAQLATDFGRQVRSVVEDKSITQAFPDFTLSKESRAADVWRTDVGGAYFAVGVGGTTSGRPANLLLVDDPIKSREDAESMTQRNKTWNYYTSALATRLQPESGGAPPKQIVILTRWHPDDLAGRIMDTEDWKEGRWKHVNFPAIKSAPGKKKISRRMLAEDDPRYVTPEEYRALSPAKRNVTDEDIQEPLWPERFPLEELKRRERLNPREFASLYQQQPYIEGGNLIKTEWWRSYPADLRPQKFTSLVITADTAFKKTETADYSVMVVAGVDTTGDMYIVDIIRGKWDFPELKQRMIRLNNEWRGKGLRAIYIEDKASGQSLIQELKRESGISVIPYKVVNDKVARANAVLPIIEGGRVFLPEESPWLDAFIDEAISFPNGNHDDQVDAMVMAIDVLSRTSISPEAWSLHTDTSQSLNNNSQDFGKSLQRSVRGLASKWNGWGL